MYSSSAIVLLLALCLCGSKALTTDQRNAVLDAHNNYRTALGLTALVYNTTIETFAQGYADGCPSGHSQNGLYGENLAFSSASDSSFLTSSVAAWYNEVSAYSCQDNSCSATCGHYTQVMWENTQSIGCGLTTACNGTWKTIVSCNYYPPGNFGGQRAFPLPLCQNYPYFSDSRFVLTVTLNTTTQAYSESSFRSALNTALSLGDTNRIYILGMTDLGNGSVEVQIYIASVGSSSGSDAAKSLVTKVENKDSSLGAAGLYATNAVYAADGSGASLSSWVDLLAQ